MPSHNGPTLDIVPGYEVIDCQTCGFPHCHPIPEDWELHDFYEQHFYEQAKPEYIARYEQDREWWKLMHGRILREFKRVVGPEKRLLDFGCGPGLFLESAVEAGFEASGVDLSQTALDYCRSKKLNVSTHAEGPYDAINLYEVLEHLPHPEQTLSELRDMTGSGGVICVTVPNDYNAFQASRPDRYFLAPPQHVNYFGFDSLERLLKRTGWTPYKRTATFPLEMFWMMGYDYVGNDRMGRACHQRRMAFDLGLSGEALEAFYGGLASAGLGREAVIFARNWWQ